MSPRTTTIQHPESSTPVTVVSGWDRYDPSEWADARKGLDA